jgi:hypothetical protein
MTPKSPRHASTPPEAAKFSVSTISPRSRSGSALRPATVLVPVVETGGKA